MVDLSLHRSSAPSLASPLGAPLAAANRLLHRWRRRSRDRRELARLDHRALRDLGLSAAQVQYEASKPFWRD